MVCWPAWRRCRRAPAWSSWWWRWGLGGGGWARPPGTSTCPGSCGGSGPRGRCRARGWWRSWSTGGSWRPGQPSRGSAGTPSRGERTPAAAAWPSEGSSTGGRLRSVDRCRYYVDMCRYHVASVVHLWWQWGWAWWPCAGAAAGWGTVSWRRCPGRSTTAAPSPARRTPASAGSALSKQTC